MGLHIGAWIVAGLWGIFVGFATTRYLKKRGFEVPDLYLLPFPLRLGLETAFLCALEYSLANYFTHGEIVHPWTHLLPGYFLTAPLVALLLTDARFKLLPNRILLPTAAVLLPLLSIFAIAQRNLWSLLRIWVLALAAGVILGLATLAGLGMGDVKLGALLSAWMGLYGWMAPVVMLFIATVLGGVLALGQLVTRRFDLKSHIAFGPWLICGAFITWILYLPGL